MRQLKSFMRNKKRNLSCSCLSRRNWRNGRYCTCDYIENLAWFTKNDRTYTFHFSHDDVTITNNNGSNVYIFPATAGAGSIFTLTYVFGDGQRGELTVTL